MRKKTSRGMSLLVLFLLLLILLPGVGAARELPFRLGNEVLLDRYVYLLADKRVGLITNQSGVDSQGVLVLDRFAQHPDINLTALYSPEHGLDGVVRAGQWVESQVHPSLGVPVYSLYGQTRKPTRAMLANVDVLVYDMQDVGSRTYTYISTLRYCMEAAKEAGIPIVVLDRPNPVGGLRVEGPVLEAPYRSFVGVDLLPMAHGMTIGELALFFNRDIGASLSVVTMQGWTRDMLWQDTGLNWVQTSPNIPNIASLFGYMATGIGEGTGVFQADQFTWIGGRGLDSVQYASLLNTASLPGIRFLPETRGEAGGVRLVVTDYHQFNPARTGFYALSYAFMLGDFRVPLSTPNQVVMFDKVMGTDQVGQYLAKGLTPQEIETRFEPALAAFRKERGAYLLYGLESTGGYLIDPREISVLVRGLPLSFDVAPYIDSNQRLMVPLRAITEALGAVVDWDPTQGRIELTQEERRVHFFIGRLQVRVNDREQTMDTVPVIRNQRTLVPLRYVGEYLGAQVTWDGGLRRVTVE